MDEIDLAWCAGFFDGEGVVGLVGRELRVQVKQNATIAGDAPDTLRRFANGMGVGRVGGPYADRPTRRGFSPNRQPYYMWYARGDQARQALARLWPQLGDAKRSAAAIAGERAA